MRSLSLTVWWNDTPASSSPWLGPLRGPLSWALFLPHLLWPAIPLWPWTYCAPLLSDCCSAGPSNTPVACLTSTCPQHPLQPWHMAHTPHVWGDDIQLLQVPGLTPGETELDIPSPIPTPPSLNSNAIPSLVDDWYFNSTQILKCLLC